MHCIFSRGPANSGLWQCKNIAAASPEVAAELKGILTTYPEAVGLSPD
jgi:hypothetical protein